MIEPPHDANVLDRTRPSSVRRRATVTAKRRPSERAVILRLRVPDRVQHLPGQHYVIRLTAPDGYVAQRSYSIASPPSDPQVEFYIEWLPDGEVSTFLAEVVEVGDELDVRGPIGGWFVWNGDIPLLGVGGGSGAVPFRAMLRHAEDVDATHLLTLALSARTHADLPYAEEFGESSAVITYTRASETSDPTRPQRTTRQHRLDAEDLRPLLTAGQLRYVCGSASFSAAAISWMDQLAVPTDTIRIESFGPSAAIRKEPS